ncbi:GNAT family N-acetyltransferase [Actinopolyspora mortivallis]|uniref:GNAT family N-acetyltransferase n=1 Tax=Actinopolyspora mortivallis TaxID=33906 RepID=A0A2T0GRP3_ACTMO|nr:GNAT family N-acetyltransferase [Actinopolyspora mortivallis]PRW61770.1 GNAT family N-acetyltransferase [Actinopolyspora mortivallis]
MLKLAGARLLQGRDVDNVRTLLETDPVAACMVLSRIEAARVNPTYLGGELWGYGDGPEGVCYSGPNLIPLRGGRDAMRAFADRARRRGRVSSSLVGPAEQVMSLWEELAAHWGPAREVRAEQPLLVLTEVPERWPDPAVRRVRSCELDHYLPAAVAMFREEVGVDPLGGTGAGNYRARIADLIAGGRAFARFEDGQVVFKAEIGALSSTVGQIQGVWVHPRWRGNGLGAAGTAAVADHLVRHMGRVASLYVNDYNTPARRAYERIGFRRGGTFSTVLL